MIESEALTHMVPPGQRRPNKKQMLDGVVQVHITRACDLSCVSCTQGSNLAGKPVMMTPDQAEEAFISLKGHFGVVGVFGGNPAVHPQFEEICARMRNHIPYERRGLWCNHPRGKGKIMAATFNPVTSNLNCHQSREAFEEFKRDWPASRPFGADYDSRHAPCYVAMKDVIEDEGLRWDLISRCDVNANWSSLVGVFRGKLRAWFCEIAAAQSMLHAHEPDYPDTGLPLWIDGVEWWRLPMTEYAGQVRKHCHECSVPLHGYGALACDENAVEQTSQTHEGIFKPKTKGRRVELVTKLEQLGMGRISNLVDYVGNAKR